jgi:aspartyl-tRNA(Asn)/glutamyl-tRNA(Gln) amidotransferase subunit C
MSLSREEVQHIARLARIGLTGKEEGKFQKDIASVFGLIAELKEAKVEGGQVTAENRGVNRSREDVAVRQDDPSEIAKNFPSHKDGFNKVRSVF